MSSCFYFYILIYFTLVLSSSDLYFFVSDSIDTLEVLDATLLFFM